MKLLDRLFPPHAKPVERLKVSDPRVWSWDASVDLVRAEWDWPWFPEYRTP